MTLGSNKEFLRGSWIFTFHKENLKILTSPTLGLPSDRMARTFSLQKLSGGFLWKCPKNLEYLLRYLVFSCKSTTFWCGNRKNYCKALKSQNGLFSSIFPKFLRRLPSCRYIFFNVRIFWRITSLKIRKNGVARPDLRNF